MRYTNIVNDVVLWIENNKYHNLKIEEIAEKSGFSRRHLQRFFKEKTSMNIGSYSRKRRLSTTAIALRVTQISVKEISKSFGFDSSASFITAFKNQFGLTPQSFRNLQHWPFKNMMPRFDFLNKVKSMDFDFVKEHCATPFLKTSDINDIIYSIDINATYTILVANSATSLEFSNESDIDLVFSFCGNNKSPGKYYWISLKLSEPVENIFYIRNILYTCLLPWLKVTRPNLPDMIKIKKENNITIIKEYLVPCIPGSNGDN